MRLIRKTDKNAIKNSTISTQDIIALDTGSSVVLTEPVKKSVVITYDALGYPDIDKIDLGVQYDHRVTWLHFILDDLIWNLNERYGYNQDTKYQHYTFKLALTRINHSITEETTVWEFDGVDFEVPRGITKNAGLYRMILMIEEYQGDDFSGNLKPDQLKEIERFVAAEIKGKVIPSCYSPLIDFDDTIRETDQNASLRKPQIICTLNDNGVFIPETTELGQQFDNFIRYFKFNPRTITAHLNDFYVYAIFKQNDKSYYSMFERTNPDDPNDDYSVAYPLIAWIPTNVYESYGSWDVCIVAFTGNINDINNPLESDNGDYYFYVSEKIRMKVIKNQLTKDDVTREPIISVTTNLLTGAGEIIITTDDNIFQTKRRGKD